MLRTPPKKPPCAFSVYYLAKYDLHNINSNAGSDFTEGLDESSTTTIMWNCVDFIEAQVIWLNLIIPLLWYCYDLFMATGGIYYLFKIF